MVSIEAVKNIVTSVSYNVLSKKNLRYYDVFVSRVIIPINHSRYSVREYVFSGKCMMLYNGNPIDVNYSFIHKAWFDSRGAYLIATGLVKRSDIMNPVIVAKSLIMVPPVMLATLGAGRFAAELLTVTALLEARSYGRSQAILPLNYRYHTPLEPYIEELGWRMIHRTFHGTHVYLLDLREFNPDRLQYFRDLV